MADGGSNAKDQGSRVYDPRNDASWQARLEEARAKRERVLSQRPPKPRQTKRLKPWEEEGAVLIDDDEDDFAPGQSGLEFSARVDAMRECAEAVEPEQGELTELERAEPMAPEHTAPMERKRPRPSKQKYSRLVASERTAPVEAEPEGGTSAYSGTALDDVFADPEDDSVLRARALSSGLRVVSRPPVNRVAYDPHGPGGEEISQPEPEPDYIPIQEIRTGPPEPVRPSRVPNIEPEITPSKLTPAPDLKELRDEKKPALWRLLLFFLFAASIGPIYQFTRPYEWGPTVYLLPGFATEPALGLTAPLFAVTTTDAVPIWQPPSKKPPTGPLKVARPSIPVRTEKVGGLFGSPGESDLKVSLGTAFSESESPGLRASSPLTSGANEIRFWPESTLAILDYCCTAP